MGRKMTGRKDGQSFFSPVIFLPQNCLLLERGTDGALAGISGLGLAAGRCFIRTRMV
jgi:hypothetical protein